jgi:hypothetical protein
MGNQASRIQEGSPLACLLKHWKDLDPESIQQKRLKFYCTRLGHSILWEMRKDGQKEGALIINHSSIRYVL